MAGPWKPSGRDPISGGSRDMRRANLLRSVCWIVLGLLVVGGVVVLITWLALQPHKPKYYLDYGTVSQFTIADGTLNSTFHFDITTRNPNKKIGIYYDSIEALVLYDYQRIAWAWLPPFYQGHKNTTFLHPKISGLSVPLESDISRDLKLERSSGKLDLIVKLRAKIRFKVGHWKSHHYTMKVKCNHAILDMNRRSFDRTKCRVRL